MSKDIFENLVTDITAKVLEQVQQQVNVVVINAVNNSLENLVDNNQVNKMIDERVNRSVKEYQPDLTTVEQTLRELTNRWADTVSGDLKNRVDVLLRAQVESVDLNALIIQQLSSKLDPQNTTYPFPEKSINGAALNTVNLKITGDNISGGVITNFGSTGIDDKASGCMVTIMDQGTVFENTLYAPHIEIKGGAVIDGDLEIQGKITDNPAYRQLVADVASETQTNITDDVLERHQNLIFQRIQAEGVDLNRVTFNGRLLVDGDRLVGVVNSQLRTVGVLQDLQTSGDTFLSDTLYTAGKRVGINTMDPKSALSVWDEEIEVSVGKNQRGVGRIAVERDNDLVLGSNSQDNITLKADGTTVIPKLQLNNLALTTSASPPSYSAVKGTIVFNENPSLGGPLGWVSLGDARWANFGIID